MPVIAAAAVSVAACVVLVTVDEQVVLGIAGAIAFAVLTAAFLRAPHVMGAALVVFLLAQPALRTFVSPALGPAKDVVVIAACAAALLSLATRRRDHARLDAWLVAGVLLLLLLYVANPAGEHDEGWFHATRLVVESFGLFLAAQALPRPERTWRWTVVALAAGCVGVALLGLLQQRIGLVRLVEGWGYTYGEQVRQTATGQLRSFGSLDEPFSYALVLLLGLAALTVGLRARPFTFVAGAVVLLGLTASFVRTAAGILAALAIVCLARAGRVASALALGAAVLLASATVLVAVPQTETSSSASGTEFLLTLNGRTESWGVLVPSTEAWIAGRGVGEVGVGAARSSLGDTEADGGAAPIVTTAEFQRRNVDSSYFATVADVGLVGLALLLAVIARAGVLALRGARCGSRAAWLALAAGVVVLLDAATRSSLTSVPAGYLALWLLGTSLAAAQAERRRARPATPPVHQAAISA